MPAAARIAAAAALLAVVFAAPARAEPLPLDGGIVNVRDFGARGDGSTDDTAALNAAIAASGGDTGRSWWHDKIVYLPDGTYLVSAPLLKRYPTGGFASGLFLMGQSRDRTVIRLADRAPGFDAPQQTRAVIFTSSKQLDGTPTSGGKDYPRLGEGNDAYMNFVQDLTVDVGGGNRGAVAIDYLANNIGAVRNVTLRAGSDSGAIGLSMTRKWPGPALIQNVRIAGFDIGIAAAQTEYGLTFDHVDLEGQRVAAVRNDGNVLSFHDLTARGPGAAIINKNPKGMIAIDGGHVGAIDNAGIVVARRSDIRPGSEGATVLSPPRWAPQPEDSPAPPRPPPDQWANAARFGAVAGSDHDSTEALNRAFASGAVVVYLPNGEYWISAPLQVPPGLRRIVGMNSTIRVLPKRQPGFSRDAGMLRIASGGPPISVENLALDNTNLGHQLGIEVAGPRDVTIRDVASAGVVLLDRKPGGGRAFIEDVCCGAVQIAGGKPVFARQLDTEGGGVRITNNGAPLWLVGLKTEGIATVVDNRAGARSDVFGGLIYMVHNADPASPTPAFRNAGGWLSATLAEESLRRESRYGLYLEDRSAGQTRQTDVANFPERGLGRFIPNLVATPEGVPGQ